MKTRWRNIGLALKVLLRVLIDPRQRQLFQAMRAFIRQLPIVLKAPILQALQSITPTVSARSNAEQSTRELADVVALLDRASPLGLCLRRSLTRYHFLRELSVPVTLHFGAKLIGGQPDRSITGHAWLTLNDQIYFEASENYRGFSVMLTFPQTESEEAQP
jgi:hypothetical protein